MSSIFLFFTFLFLELFLDEHAMVLRYMEQTSESPQKSMSRFCTSSKALHIDVRVGWLA